MTKNLELLITCDDGGLSPGIDEAVIQLYQQGMVSSVSVMTNMPYARDALSKYADYPVLEIGAHLNLSEGQALTESARHSALSKDGIFAGRYNCFLQGLFLTNPLQTIVFDELDAQMQVFIDQNVQPAHITTHHHFHLVPKMRAIIYELARKYNVNWIRNSRLDGAILPFNPLVNRAPTKLHPNPLFTEPDFVVLVQEWIKKSPQALLSELQQLSGLIELVIHPCTAVDDLFPKTLMYSPEERHQELDFIQSLWTQANGEINVIKVNNDGI